MPATWYSQRFAPLHAPKLHTHPPTGGTLTGIDLALLLERGVAAVAAVAADDQLPRGHRPDRHLVHALHLLSKVLRRNWTQARALHLLKADFVER